MKTEKIEKHRARRTVVRGIDEVGVMIGVIEATDQTNVPIRIRGMMVRDCPFAEGGWYCAHEVRKATDDERHAFFAWIVSDGNDLADGFARFGGAPRGFEAWRTALLSGEPAPEGEAPAVPAVGWMFTTPKAAFTVGQRVRLVSGGGLPPLLCFTNGGIYTVRKVLPGDLCVELELEPGETGMATPDQIEPAPVEPEPPAPKHKRGDLRVWLRRNGIGAVARVTSAGAGAVKFVGGMVHLDDEVYEPTRETVAMLVAKQQERGIAPEVGDLVFVMGEGRALERGAIALVTGTFGELVLSIPVWGNISRQPFDALVIRRNPLRELGDE